MKELQEWAGHSSYTTTANIYSHLQTDSKNKLSDAMKKHYLDRFLFLVRKSVGKQFFEQLIP